MKKFASFLMATLISAFGFVTGASANTITPNTGDKAAELVPIFIGLMVLAIVALVVCMILLKKKK